MEKTFCIALFVLISIGFCWSYTTRFYIKKYECASDGEFVIDPVCRLKAVSRNVQHMTVAMTVKKPITNAWLRVSHAVKTYTNHLRPGYFDFKTDFCLFLNGTVSSSRFLLNAMETFSPILSKEYQKNVKVCPLLGHIPIFNATKNRTTTDQFLMPPGEYRVLYRLYTTQNVTLMMFKETHVYEDKKTQS